MKTNGYYPSAWIVSPNDRGRKKIYLDSKVYLDNGSEFQIEMFNPLTSSVLAELKINGKLASTSGLILRPGERFFLDCNIDDRKKFIFKTYEIDGTDSDAQKAIANNGFVEVSFYREKTKLYKHTTRSFSAGTGLPNYSLCNTSGLGCVQPPKYFMNFEFDMDMDFMNQELLRESPKTLKSKLKQETGRIEKGNTSNQTFESVSMDFETYCLNRVSYQLLPESKKPIETTELKKRFCTTDGYQFKGNEKFCPYCGTRA